MKTNILQSIAISALALMAMPAMAQTMNIEHKGDTTIINIQNPTKYIILPVQESREESKVLLSTGSPADTWMDVRLAQDKVDYYVPFELTKGEKATIKILNLKNDALTLKNGQLRLSNTWDVTNTDYYRPIIHHTPSYGWMNDANGLVYKDGEYHLYFQYNPYGSKWGNMHWGHSVSKDMLHWKELSPAIARDTLGHIFSGSSVVDKYNSAGYGKNAIIAFYTSASDKNGQIQCMAYSTDNGRTFTKYENNPILRPFDGLKDFRDPKVFWYEPQKMWYMIVSADKEMRFYSSKNLKDWTYQSAFGKGYGAQPNQFECPDFIQLPVDGNKNHMKYVMIVNINPGCLFGGSATQYFVGDFDGKTFTCDTKPEVVKWLDYGKDHYATVCFSNTDDRIIAVPWMSNWQYANVTPIKQYRGANAIPRELSLYTKDGQIYMAANAIPEVKSLRKDTKVIKNLTVSKAYTNTTLAKGAKGAMEIEMDVTPGTAKISVIEIYNAKGEKAKIYFDMKAGKLVMDRTESGLTDFGNLAAPHDIEKNFDAKSGNAEPMRKINSINYKNDFALATWAPLNLCNGKTYHVNIIVDKCSVEIFVDGGRIAMTNLVFPTIPYDSLKFYSVGGKTKFSNINVSKLAL